MSPQSLSTVEEHTHAHTQSHNRSICCVLVDPRWPRAHISAIDNVESVLGGSVE